MEEGEGKKVGEGGGERGEIEDHSWPQREYRARQSIRFANLSCLVRHAGKGFKTCQSSF